MWSGWFLLRWWSHGIRRVPAQQNSRKCHAAQRGYLRWSGLHQCQKLTTAKIVKRKRKAAFLSREASKIAETTQRQKVLLSHQNHVSTTCCQHSHYRREVQARKRKDSGNVAIYAASSTTLKIPENIFNQKSISKYQSVSVTSKLNQRIFSAVVWVVKAKSWARLQSVILEYMWRVGTGLP